MAFLTIAATAYEVQQSNAVESDPETIGAATRAFSGALRSSERGEKRAWSFTLAPLSRVQYDALRAAIAGGAFVACGGDFLPVGGLTCLVKITAAPFMPSGLGYVIVPTVSLREV